MSGQTLTFDADGNLTSDGQRNYSWDAENRLVGITYPAQPGKATAFTYDGLGRRTAIASTPAGGGSAVTASYIWCGTRICQARNASNSTTREYYSEGEFVPGSPVQPYYYGPDQIGSVRRVFASTTSAPAYGYDPYGNALQATAPLTDFGYANMFYNADSGLYLTQYRAYDPVAGRWLSRDPVEGTGGDEGSIIAASLADALQSSSTPSDMPSIQRNSNGSAADHTMKITMADDNPNLFVGGINVGNYSLLSRFLQENPTSLRHLMTNLYIYVDDNPVSRIDPDGQDYRSWRSWAVACYMLICWKNFPPPPPHQHHHLFA